MQDTTTYTSTITYSITSSPVVISKATSTWGVASTIKNTYAVTLPSATAKKTQSITPPGVFTTSTKTMTRTRGVWTKQLNIKTETSTAICITPAPWSHTPTLVHPAALKTPTVSPNRYRDTHKSDRALSINYARARIEAARSRRD
jgi:hypothetical protein